MDQALVDLSGGIGSRIDMSKDPYKQQTRNGVLFKQLLQYRNSGFLLGAGSPAGSDSEANASPSGIVQGHGQCDANQSSHVSVCMHAAGFSLPIGPHGSLYLFLSVQLTPCWMCKRSTSIS